VSLHKAGNVTMSNYQKMIRTLFTLLTLTWAIAVTVPAFAAELVVTRYFSGLWDQPHQESQGIVLQVIDQEEDGHKKAVAYWFTYGDSLDTAWYMAIGKVIGDRIEMSLYTAEGVAFMEDDAPGNAHVYSVGTLILWFHNCNKGIASYDIDGDSAEFEIKRLAGLYNSRCSGGISDDTPSNAKPLQMEVELEPAREGITGNGKAKFWERVDRSDFHVSAEDIPDGPYDIMICDPLENVGSLTVEAGEGQTEFRSPEAAGKELLSFDPRNCVIELHDGGGAVLSSGAAVLTEKSTGNGGGGGGNGKSEIAVELDNTGVYPAAEGEASYLEKNNSIEFEVEIKGVPMGAYPLRVDDILRGEIDVADDDDPNDDTLKGKLRFSNPQKEQRELLDFDPRGQWIEVYDDGTIIFEVEFPE
jgi:hypothetical protein